MNPNKFLYQCWVFIMKMNQNSKTTLSTLITNLSQLDSFRSMHGTHLYRMIYDDRYNKMKPIFKQLDSSMMRMASKKSLAFHITRLKVLLKYELPYESSLAQLIPMLSSQISRVNLIDLCHCLIIVPAIRSITFSSLMFRIYQLIQQQLDCAEVIDNAFLLAILRFISRSSYKTPQSLERKLTKILDNSLHRLENKQFFVIANMMLPKSNAFLWQSVKREEKLVSCRILARKYLKNIYGVAFEEAMIPGKTAESCQQIEEAISCVQSMMHKQPYLQIFSQNLLLENNSNTPKIWSLYIDYLYYHMKKEYYRLPQETVTRLITSLSKLMNTSNFNAIIKNTNLLKLYAILFDISRDDSTINPIKKQFMDVYTFIKAEINEKYINNHSFQNYQLGQLQYLAHLLLYQAALIIQGQIKTTLDIKLIEMIIKLRKGKFKNNIYQKLQELINFISKGAHHLLKQATIISKDPMTHQQVTQIKTIFPYLFKRDDCHLYKRVVINPNIEVSYALLDDNCRLIWSLDYDAILNCNNNYVEGSSLLPLRSAWKQVVLAHLGCDYHASS